MNIMAVYHANRLSALDAEAGLTSVRKGRHVLCAIDVVSDGELMAAALGWLRNRAQLSRDLGYSNILSATDLTIAAYRRWGAEYPVHMEGPVVTVLIDRSADRMVVSRDRMGDRRVFYCRHGRTVAVSDHPDALLKSPYASRVIDANGLNELFALGPARTPGRTPLKDVMALEPGCALISDRGGVSVKRYYSMEARPHEDNAEATVLRVREHLERAVEDIMPFTGACMLSGGLDSTALAALMCYRGTAPMAFSVDYEDDTEDFTGNAFQPERDREYAKMAAELFASEQKNVVLGFGELSKALSAAVDARGFPGMADIDSSLLLFGREIAPIAGAVVSGECGDEVFCGYPWFARDSVTKAEGFPWSGSMDLRVSMLKREVAEIINPRRYAREAYLSAIESVPALPGEDAEDARLRMLQSLCFRFFMSNLQERMLCMCERSSLSVYTPFSDERLAEYVWNTPRDMKFMGGEVKGLLRAAVADLLPEKLLRRKKSPYPKVYSALYTREMRTFVLDMLMDGASPINKVINTGALGALAASELPPSGLPWFGQLMSGPQMLAYIWQINDWLYKRNIEIVL